MDGLENILIEPHPCSVPDAVGPPPSFHNNTDLVVTVVAPLRARHLSPLTSHSLLFPVQLACGSAPPTPARRSPPRATTPAPARPASLPATRPLTAFTTAGVAAVRSGTASPAQAGSEFAASGISAELAASKLASGFLVLCQGGDTLYPRAPEVLFVRCLVSGAGYQSIHGSAYCQGPHELAACASS